MYYTSDSTAQAQYLAMFDDAGIPVVVLDKVIDTQFITLLEQDRSVKFLRIDSEVAQAVKGEGEKLESKELEELFRRVSGNDKLKVSFENLANAGVPALLNVSEDMRRFDDMMKMYSAAEGSETGAPMAETTLILNSNSPLVRKLADNPDERVAKQIYTLTLLSQRRLTASELKDFLKTSFDMLEKSF